MSNRTKDMGEGFMSSEAQKWREVVKEYRYIRTKFKDPVKMLVAADKSCDEFQKALEEDYKRIKILTQGLVKARKIAEEMGEYLERDYLNATNYERGMDYSKLVEFGRQQRKILEDTLIAVYGDPGEQIKDKAISQLECPVCKKPIIAGQKIERHGEGGMFVRHENCKDAD